jgi:hypothetical protein
VGHLLDRDRHDALVPVAHRGGLVFGETAPVGLQRERGIEVAAKQVVLELRGLGEQMQQLLAGLACSS